jgi:hypothetical protein
MSSRSDSLNILRKLNEKEDETKENLLEIVGLSPAILGLGLTKDELYDHCKRVARDLLVRVHPDAHGGVIAPEVKKFSNAFNRLEDRKNFERALDEFREMHRYERVEEKNLLKRNKELNANLTALQEQFNRVQKGQARSAQWLESYIAGQSMSFFPKVPIKRLSESSTLTVVSFTLSVADAPIKTAIPALQDFYAEALKHRRVGPWIPEGSCGTMRQIMNNNHLDSKLFSELVQESKNKGEPNLVWNFNTALDSLNLKYIPRTKWIGKVPELDLSPDLTQKYWVFLEQFSGIFGDRYVSEAQIVPEKIMLENQLLRGDSINGETLFILGTIGHERALAAIRDTSQTTIFRCLVAPDTLWNAEPFLFPGRCLLAYRAPKALSLQSKNSNILWDSLMAKREEAIRRKNYFVCSHLIIDVEQ